MRRPYATPTDLKRDLVVDDKSDVVVSPVGPADTVVICFTGLRDSFGIRVERFDAFLAQRGISAVYLRDENASGYAQGIKSLSGDFESSVDRLGDLLAPHQGKKIIMFGYSVGCVGAGMFGLILRAHSVALFAPVVSMCAEFREQAQDVRARSIAERGEAALGQRSGLHYWLGLGTHETRVDLIYGPKYYVDRYHAESLVDYPHVRLHPMDDVRTHSVINELEYAGKLPGVIDMVLAS